MKKYFKIVVNIICVIALCLSIANSICYKSELDATQQALSDSLRGWKKAASQVKDLEQQIAEYEALLNITEQDSLDY